MAKKNSPTRATSMVQISLDSKLQKMQQAAGTLRRPRIGWIRTIRTALGMTNADLARQLGINPTSALRLERQEIQGTIKLDSLSRVAEALDCELVYALVPRQSIENTIYQHAKNVAEDLVARTQQSMALEDQSVESFVFEQILKRQIDELKSDKNLWKYVESKK